MYTIQKPIKLLERIIKASSNIGDLVLDPFAGTGTGLYVCQKLKRNFIGIEIDPKLIAVVKKRLKDNLNQPIEDIKNIEKIAKWRQNIKSLQTLPLWDSQRKSFNATNQL